MSNYTEKCLLDAWEVSGSKDKQAMYNLLEEMSNATGVIRLKSNAIQLFTVWDVSSTSLNGYLHNSSGTINTSVPLVEMRDQHGLTPELLRETVQKCGLMVKLGNEYFYTDKHILKTLSQRAGSAMGDFALRDELKIRFPRDSGYVSYMNTVVSDCCVMYRKVGKTKKTFAVFTGRYKLLQQYPLIKDMIEQFEKEMGPSDLVFYKINNFMTEVYLEFPEKAKDFQKVYSLPDDVVPGILIHLSDSGDSSFFINGTTRLKKITIFVPGAEYGRQHTTSADPGEMYEEVGKRIFSAYTKMPERFMELVQIQIDNPAECIKKVGEYLDLRKAVGARIENSFIDSLVDLINPTVPYTAYDITSIFIEEGVGLEWIEEDDGNGGYVRKKRNTDAVTKLRNCLSRAAFFKYESL